MTQYKELLLIQYLIINFAASVKSQSNCMPITTRNRFGNKPDGSCFEISISDLNQMIIHTQTNIIGFTFNFKNGSNQSYIENWSVIKNFVIDLNNIYMTGVDIYVGRGIEALKLQLYDSMTQNFNSTEIIGDSQNGCFSYLNSSFFKSQSLVIDSIKGCLGNNQLNYFPFLVFKYSFSQCPIQVIYPQNPTTSMRSLNISAKILNTPPSSNSIFSNPIKSSTIIPSLTSSAINLSVFLQPTTNSITDSSWSLSYSTNINSFTLSSTTFEVSKSQSITIINTITSLETSKLILTITFYLNIFSNTISKHSHFNNQFTFIAICHFNNKNNLIFVHQHNNKYPVNFMQFFIVLIMIYFKLL
jgi:hypothetical protein